MDSQNKIQIANTSTPEQEKDSALHEELHQKLLDGTIAPDAVAVAQVGQKPKQRRGFAAMDREKVKAIASSGGKAAHAAGTAHQFNSEEAKLAGKKGGIAPHVRRGRPAGKPNAPKASA